MNERIPRKREKVEKVGKVERRKRYLTLPFTVQLT